jgi:NADH dehydrogenase
VVVVGAGFGGLQAAQSLDRAGVEVLLIDRNNYHTFVPLLYQVATAQIDATSVTYPVRTLLRHKPNIRFLVSEVQQVDFRANVIKTDGATILYDYLVLATGSQTRWHGIPGAEAHTFPLRTVYDAIALRNHILSCFEQALHTPKPEVRQRLLQFVIVGGGATGVEMAGAIAELICGPLRQDFPELVRPSRSSLGVRPQILLLQAGDRLLPEFPERLGRYTVRHLTKLGVDVRLQTRIQSVRGTQIHLQTGDVLEVATVVWAAGLEATMPDSAESIPANPQGKLLVRQTLQLNDHPNVYAIGDLAHVEQSDQPLAGVAPEALQQGVAVAKNIRRQIQGRSPQPFRYFNKGRLAIVGGFGGVGQIAGIAFTGALAWLMWLAIHLVYLPGYRNRLLVLLTWLHGYLLHDRPIRQIVFASDAYRVFRDRNTVTQTAMKSK